MADGQQLRTSANRTSIKEKWIVAGIWSMKWSRAMQWNEGRLEGMVVLDVAGGGMGPNWRRSNRITANKY
jgi:hypothetical protein